MTQRAFAQRASCDPGRTKIEAGILVDFYRSHLKQVVSIHQAMFQKLLFEEDAAVGPELAELFQDVGRAYLQISQRISESRDAYHSLQD